MSSFAVNHAALAAATAAGCGEIHSKAYEISRPLRRRRSTIPLEVVWEALWAALIGLPEKGERRFLCGGCQLQPQP